MPYFTSERHSVSVYTGLKGTMFQVTQGYRAVFQVTQG